MARVPLAFAALVLLTGCAQQAPVDQPGTVGGGAIGGGAPGALSSLRPKADPAMIAKIRQEGEAARQQQIAQINQQAQENQAGFGGMANASGQMLPNVGTTSIAGGMPTAPPASEVGDGGPVVTPVDPKPAGGGIPFWPFNQPATPPAETPPAVASYGGYGGYGGGAVPPPPPGAATPGGLVPPPPAVSVSGQIAPYGAMPGVDPMNPYGANPYMQQQQMQQQAPAQRPALFGSGQRTTSADDDDAAPTKRKKDFVPITPTGMESRSPYKQRDDLKVLWKSAMAASPALQRLSAKDDKLAADLAKVDVGLPGESTKGSISVSPRQIDTVFKPAALDKKAAPVVKKLQVDLMQGYHRYLYSYNKWALAAQTVAARKQEAEVASTQSEQQRAAADLAQAQSEAEATKEDMRSAQYELSAITGPQGAATIIQRVSGAKPSVESLAMGQSDSLASAPAQADSGGGAGGILGGVGSIFGFGKGQPKVAEAPKDKSDGKKAKEVKAKKGGKPEPGQDLSAAPQAGAIASAAKEPADEPPASSSSSTSLISFELKNVNVTPRKSTLRVSIRNNGNESFSFDPDVISLSEGNRKLSEATVRAEFDATMVQPNQEVTGTITIYGRPWNDRLSVSLTDGGKTIQMRR